MAILETELAQALEDNQQLRRWACRLGSLIAECALCLC